MDGNGLMNKQQQGPLLASAVATLAGGELHPGRSDQLSDHCAVLAMLQLDDAEGVQTGATEA